MKLIFVHGGPGLNSRPEKNLLANDLIDLGLDPIFWN